MACEEGNQGWESVAKMAHGGKENQETSGKKERVPLVISAKNL